MISQVISLPISKSLSEAKNLMDENKIHHLPITEGNKLVGILSRNDIKKVDFLCEFVGGKTSAQSIFNALDLEELMSKEIITLTEHSIVKEAVDIFSRYNFQALPVVDDANNLEGIIITRDIFRAILEAY